MHFPNIVAAGLLLAASTSGTLLLHEKRTIEPSTWKKTAKAAQDVLLPVRIAVTGRNGDAGHDHLMDISDPDSPNFGKHWTPEQVYEFFAPDAETVAAVREWLHSSGISSARHKIAGSHGHIQFLASVAEVESLLATKYHVWEHPETDSVSISCEEYYLPEHVKHHIDFITPTVEFSTPGSSKLKTLAVEKRAAPGEQPRPISDPNHILAQNSQGNLSLCFDAVTPACIRALYHIPKPTTSQKGNDMGMYENQDTYDQKDLDSLFSNFAKFIPNGTHPILKSVDGGVAPYAPLAGSESNLDFEVAYPLIYPQQIKLYQVYDPSTASTTKGLYNLFLDALDASYCSYEGGDDPNIDPHFPDGQGYNKTRQCGAYKPTNVISFSYAQAEAFYPPAYEKRQCHEFMKLGLQGTSIIFASGDNGTVSRAGVEGCLPGLAQNPSYPATCPYVTAVGATQIIYNTTVGAPGSEEAVNPNNLPGFPPFSSGGGFSNVFARPSYQRAAVSNFLKTSKELPASSTYNSTGRAFPDVSAVGWDLVTYTFGSMSTQFGTSAAAPLLAGIITRLNGERIAAGKGPMGFLNPTFYKNPQVFNDITTGYNLGCEESQAFVAQEGWDPVTGLGTPNFPKMKELFMSLP